MRNKVAEKITHACLEQLESLSLLLASDFTGGPHLFYKLNVYAVSRAYGSFSSAFRLLVSKDNARSKHQNARYFDVDYYVTHSSDSLERVKLKLLTRNVKWSEHFVSLIDDESRLNDALNFIINQYGLAHENPHFDMNIQLLVTNYKIVIELLEMIDSAINQALDHD